MLLLVGGNLFHRLHPPPEKGHQLLIDFVRFDCENPPNPWVSPPFSLAGKRHKWPRPQLPPHGHCPGNDAGVVTSGISG